MNPTFTGDTSDIYFDISTLQCLASNRSRVNEVLVKVAKSSDVTTVAAAIHKELPGAQVLTSKSLANSVTGSLSNAHTLATHLVGALAIIVLLAAFLIAGAAHPVEHRQAGAGDRQAAGDRLVARTGGPPDRR